MGDRNQLVDLKSTRRTADEALFVEEQSVARVADNVQFDRGVTDQSGDLLIVGHLDGFNRWLLREIKKALAMIHTFARGDGGNVLRFRHV